MPPRIPFPSRCVANPVHTHAPPMSRGARRSPFSLLPTRACNEAFN
ncbi:hypothetical protein X949_5569 [Burkholderia pseudomallei MSHR5609]|nr:hypothetical protein X949_5569 [Burkholderia pseudomallei MSHR5609]